MTMRDERRHTGQESQRAARDLIEKSFVGEALPGAAKRPGEEIMPEAALSRDAELPEEQRSSRVTRRGLLAGLGTAAAGLMLTGSLGTGRTAAAAGAAPWYNVKDYGAQGTGRYDTDDSSSIRSACEAAARTGGIVYLPAGTYHIKTSLYLWPGVTLLGDGPRASVIRSQQTGLSLINARDVSGASVVGLGFAGTGTLLSNTDPSTAEKGVFLNACEDIRIENCRFTQAAGGIWLTDCRHVSVRGCTFQWATAAQGPYAGSGIVADGGGHHRFADNRFNRMKEPAVQLSGGCSHSRVTGNWTAGCTGAFILLESTDKPCAYNQVEGNTVSAEGLMEGERGCTYGIRLRGYCTDNLLNGNVILDASAAGIALEGDSAAGSKRPSSNRIAGSKIVGAAKGIVLLNCEGSSVSGNDVRGAKIGIELNASGAGGAAYCRYHLITGNQLFGCSTAGIQLSAASCLDNTVYGNAGAGNGEALIVPEGVKVLPGF